MTTALGGIRVLDQTQVMAGPFCSMLLADMGADVVKIEPPGGEHTRREQEIAPGVSASFLAVNRNKRSLVLDLKQPDGVAVLKRLVATADVLVENYRPGVARRLGIDAETLSAINPRLIYCSISGFGRTGPYADRGGYDLIAQGLSGIMSATGSDGHFTVGAAKANLWSRFATLLGLPHLIEDPRFDTVPNRLKNRAALELLVEAVTVTQTRAHWLAKCEAAGIPAGPIYTVPEAHADPHARARGMVQELEHPQIGRVKTLGNPVKMSSTPPRLRTAAPMLGADTDAILLAAGYDGAEIATLRAAKVV